MDVSLQYMNPRMGESRGGSGGAGGNAPPGQNVNGNPPPPPPPAPKARAKKPKTLKSQASSKIQVCSSKLTDVKIWLHKVQESVLQPSFAK